MQFVRQMGAGVIYALVSIVLVIGGLSLALAESYTITQPSATATLPATSEISSSTPPGLGITSTALPPPSQTPLPPNNCLPPAGWIPILVGPGDTLASLAAQYQITPAQLTAANCLFTSGLVPGYNIYVPPLPTSLAIPCGPFPGWKEDYVVQPGDTLFHIALQYGTSVNNLRTANCKAGSVIFAGELLWVPDVATITPGVTLIPTFITATLPPTAAQEATSTSQPVFATSTPSPAATPSEAPPTDTATLTPYPDPTP